MIINIVINKKMPLSASNSRVMGEQKKQNELSTKVAVCERKAML